ncbi:MAG TPA: OmpA family protein [Syntrophales bacterium]|nr:OmpA family protein [Syntrophales bacterium]HOM07592.1 OmpA family protein [Syntrophales bacterium]HOO00203.1 OmpA family protein [Syntrophales bacterium]HPC01582.1 OmpA family protein [Syntrophales bacterium]HPQ07168.1 OmpA family protein [Syntrophales bacterium]
MRKIIAVAAVVALALALGGCALVKTGAVPAPPTPVDLNPKLASGQFVQKVDVFEVIADSTMSMADPYLGSTKLKVEKDLLSLFDGTIPDLRLTAAARAFGSFEFLGGDTSRLLYGPEPYRKSRLPMAAADLSPRGLSPLNTAIDGAAQDLRDQSGRMALIIFSDGEDMEAFRPEETAARMKGAYGDRICIYAVHLGETAAGRKQLQRIVDAGGCGFVAKGADVASPAGMADFVSQVFLKAPGVVARPAPTPPPKEEVVEAKPQAQAAPVVTPKEPLTIRLNIEFDTAKAVIKHIYHNEIKRVADFMKEHPTVKAVIEGHTDNVGKEAANMKLSQRRADAVMQYLVTKFKIDASRLEAVGYGPHRPIATNKTKEGRQHNRRVTAVFSGI